MALKTYDFICNDPDCVAIEYDGTDTVLGTYPCMFDAIVRTETDADGEVVILEMPKCPDCSGNTHVSRTLSAPNIMRASFPDGRRRDDSFYIMKEAYRLRKEARGLRPEKKGELLREAKKLDRESYIRSKGDPTAHGPLKGSSEGDTRQNVFQKKREKLLKEKKENDGP